MEEIVRIEIIEQKIFMIRRHKVMLDRDLASLYAVKTMVLNQAVKRNINRFPQDFMFQLSKKEMENWISQIVISNKEKMGIRRKPCAFTEQGVAMLSSVLNSERAVQVNIAIMRAFVKLRQILSIIKSWLINWMSLKERSKNTMLRYKPYLRRFESLWRLRLLNQNLK